MPGCTRFVRRRFLPACCILLSSCLVMAACSSGGTGKGPSGAPAAEASGTPREGTPEVLVPEAPGTEVYPSEVSSVDASNTSEGYVVLRYSGSNEKVKFQIKTPDGTEYTYLVTDYGNDTVYPLPGGSGAYTLTLLESVSAEDNLYAVSFTTDIEVSVADEFTPFLYPNHYVNFDADSTTVQKGAELASDCYSDLDVVTNIYDYVIKNVSYDTEKAQNVPYGYTPVIDETLSSKTGICFDYAAVMTAMLRSQRIPTKLVVGYAGDVYHAWISCYVDEIGWVDNIIEFDGSSWSLMDPTLAANNKSTDVKKYIGDGSKYIVKYTY